MMNFVIIVCYIYTYNKIDKFLSDFLRILYVAAVFFILFIYRIIKQTSINFFTNTKDDT